MRELHFLIKYETKIIPFGVRIKGFSHTFFAHGGVMVYMKNSIIVVAFLSVLIENHELDIKAFKICWGQSSVPD